MSGPSWGGRDRYDSIDTSQPAPVDGFSRAQRPYSNPNPPDYSQVAINKAAGPSVKMSKAASAPKQPPPAASYQPSYKPRTQLSASLVHVDYDPRKSIVTTKANVIVVAMDMTGSVGSWRQEILDRCCRFYTEAQKLLGNDLEIIFICYGDTRASGDLVQVAPSGSGPELDVYLKHFKTNAGGGGNFVESLELPLYYALKQIDTSSARTAYFFGVTDEGAYSDLDADDVDAVLGLRLDPACTKTAEVIRQLRQKMHVFILWCETGSYSDRESDPMTDAKGNVLMDDAYYSHPRHKYTNRCEQIKAELAELIGGDQYLPPLDLRYRVVDVMLGVIAKTTGQLGQFTKDLQQQQADNDRKNGTSFAAENLQSVSRSISMVPGAPVSPSPKQATKSLLGANLAGPAPVIRGATGAVPKSLLKK